MSQVIPFLLIAVMASCAPTLSQIGEVGQMVTAHRLRCESERAASQQGGPRCLAAQRCAMAAEPLITSDSPTRAQLQAAQVLCKVVP